VELGRIFGSVDISAIFNTFTDSSSRTIPDGTGSLEILVMHNTRFYTRDRPAPHI